MKNKLQKLEGALRETGDTWLKGETGDTGDTEKGGPQGTQG